MQPNQIVLQGTTPHEHEQQAIEFVKKELPSGDPFRVWALCDLVDVSGRRYELDLLVLGYDALYHVEIKSHPGRVSGDVVDWRFTFPDGRTIVRENPLRVAEHKSRVLGSLLDRRMGSRRPFVETLIFLSDPDVKVDLQDAARAKVVTRKQLLRAVQFGEYPGGGNRRRAPIDRPTIKTVVDALASIGLRKSEGARRVGSYKLDALLSEGPGFQDFDATHERMREMKRRARSYLVPQSTTAERREQLRRAAEREARVLTTIGDHANILRLHEYEPDGPTGGPCLLFERFAEGEPLDAFIRQNPGLPLHERLQVLEQVADALGYCHRKQVFHRGLNPAAVLVRRRLNGPGLESKLFNFQLAQAEGSHGTQYLSQLETASAVVYRAPELIENPDAASPASDVFSLGAVAYFLFTGRPPGTTLPERNKLITAVGGYLSPSAVDDSFARGTKPGSSGVDGTESESAEALIRTGQTDLEEVFKFGTDMNPVERADDPIGWVQLLIDEFTAPTPPAPSAPELDPLEARQGDILAGYHVEAVLGSGSTARVLRVSKDAHRFALKVSRSPEFDDRLLAEGEVLKKLRSDRIVGHHGTLKIAGRVALLLDDAGETLADILAREGAQSVDFAQRWGEDLLLALRVLEEGAVLHRDIKSANLAVPGTAAKRTRNLFLFDFSLADAPPDAIDIGTAVYRDPFIERRGRWDAAADRYSAAITLYEVLTGTRPRWGDGTVPAIASSELMTVEAERFDPSVRAPLLGFFQKAFAPDAPARHDSAENMRAGWLSCFLAPRSAEKERAEAEVDFATLRAETPIQAVEGLSARAKNALDRAGIVTAQQVVGLATNTLSGLRGVGRETKQEIDKLAQGLRRAGIVAPTEQPFFPEFKGDDLFIGELPHLSAAARLELEAAGLTRAKSIATASEERLARVLSLVHDGLAQVKRALLDARPVQASGEPRTIEDWVGRAFPSRNKHDEYTRELFGIDQSPGGGYVKDATELAKRHGIAQPNISVAVGKARVTWREDAGFQPLVERVLGHLSALSGVASVDQLGVTLQSELPSIGDSALRAGVALVRVVAGIRPELKQARFAGKLWLATSSEHLPAVRKLGEVADQWCEREPLPSFEQIKEELVTLVAGTPLEGAPAERCVALAAEASTRAALSARLELYPRGMSAERALRLSASALSAPRLRPERVAQLVALRYPEALPLPADEVALAALLSSHGFELHDGSFLRPAALDSSAPMTAAHAPRPVTTHGPRRPTSDPRLQEKHEFQERLKSAARNRSFRVLEVAAADADSAELQLSRVLNVSAVSLEREILNELEVVIAEREITDTSIITETDRLGPQPTEDWTQLGELVQASAERVAARLAQRSDTLLLTQPGILARYALPGPLHQLLAATQRDDGPGVFLVVPSLSDPSPIPVIHAPQGPLPIPLSSPAQRLPIPEVWLTGK